MLLRVLQAASSGKRFECSKALLRTGILSPISAVKAQHGKARISIFVSKLRPATRELSNPNIIAKLASQDFIPPGYELIYRSNLPVYLMLSQTVLAISLVGSVVIFIGLIMTDLVKSKDVTVSPEDTTVASTATTPNVSSVESNISKEAQADSNDDELPKPNPLDFEADDVELMAILVMCLVVITAAMFRLQNMVPTRIYTKKTKHCIAVSYGSIIPGRITHHEFLAGTLSPLKSKSALTQNIYKDGTGKKMVLLDHFFRYPADLHRLLGKGYDKL